MAMALGIIGLIGAGISAAGAYQQGEAAKAANEYNAIVGRQDAKIAVEQSQLQARQADRERFMRLGAIRAAQGASGGTQEGSVLDVIGDVAAQSELEKQQILYRGELRARGYRNTAALDEFGAESASTGGKLAAAGTLLSGATNTYTNYRRNTTGTPTRLG